MGTGGCGSGEGAVGAGFFVFRSDLRVPGEGLDVQLGLATVGRRGLTRTPGPRMLEATVGVPGLGSAGEREGVQGPQRHRAERRTAGPECCGGWAGPRGALARALGGRSEPGFSEGPKRRAPRGEEAARAPSAVQAHAAWSARPTRSQPPGSSRARGSGGSGGCPRPSPPAGGKRSTPGGGSERRGAAGRGRQQRETEYRPAGGERQSRELAPPPLLQKENYLLLKL